MKLQNKTVLITGATSGIGEACALELAKKQCNLILVGRRRAELDRVVALIATQTGMTPISVAADITKESDREKIAKATENAGQLSLLINNAGITVHGRFENTVPGVLEKAIELNLYAAVYLTQSVLQTMKETPGRKKIVYVSTPSALRGIPDRFAYSASKAAAGAWMEAIRVELHQYEFDTLMFYPGYTRTALRTSGLGADGNVISEAQARGSKSPEEVANILVRGIQKDKRTVFTNMTGRVVYYARTLAPGFLESMLIKKLKKDFHG